jgi:uncharacterized integral membrane protein (TIGR00698 family)
MVLAPYTPGLNEVMLAIILGVIVFNSISLPATFQPGIAFSSSKILEWAIIFMAFSISLEEIKALGWFNLALVLLIIIIILLISLGLSRSMRCPSQTSWMVGFGTAICGSSAIAALAPSLADKEGGSGIAIAAINLIGAAGMLLLPFLFRWLPLEEEQMGFIIGSSLHSVGNVAGAGYGLEKYVGDLAITVKMARVALLSPAIVFFLFALGKHRGAQSAHRSTARFRLPYYLWAFMAITLLHSLWPLPEWLSQLFQWVGTILLTIAMAGIGLKISFKQLYRSGRRAMLFGMVLFILHLLLISSLALLFV